MFHFQTSKHCVSNEIFKLKEVNAKNQGFFGKLEIYFLCISLLLCCFKSSGFEKYCMEIVQV